MAAIKITGTGKASRPANYTEVTVTVKRTAKTCAEAVEKTDGRVCELFRLIEEKGFGKDVLKTTNFGVSAEYENERKDGEYIRKFIGFSCREGLKLCFPFTAQALSAAVSVLCGEGAEEQVSIAFTVEQSEALKSEALEKAYADALSQANTLARASGKKLGKLLTINSGGAEGVPYSATAVVPAALSARSVSVAPEDVGLSVSVTAEWELE